MWGQLEESPKMTKCELRSLQIKERVLETSNSLFLGETAEGTLPLTNPSAEGYVKGRVP
jgi:hypothetical protein